ncbi:MAG: GNAT family N-acetyltransferase [Candidatus Cloacimonetes bacterium]|nr:GNAT family N-acetyltransferase [Candidatus Cloacimonadota bacterium]
MIRKIKAEDKTDVLKISSKIWEGDDYIPQIFDEWVKDPHSIFAGLWVDKKLIGFGKLTFLSPTDIWLEGLRKDPQTKIKGVGKQLTAYYFDFLKGKNISSIRFSTYFDNIASIRFNEKTGFKRVLTLSLKVLKIGNSKKKPLPDNISAPVDFIQLREYLKNSSYLNLCNNFIGKGWVVHSCSEQLLQQFVNENKVIVWQENGKIKGAGIYSEVFYKDEFWISLLEAENEEIFTGIKDHFINIALEKKKKYLNILVPKNNNLLKFCNKTGFESWEQENDFFLYELPKDIIRKITGIHS